MTKILFILLSIGGLMSSVTFAQSSKKYLFDQKGETVAYIDSQNSLYGAKDNQQIAYLIVGNDPGVLDVYNLEGQKLGFFRDGILYNYRKQVAAHLLGAMDKIERANQADKGIQSVLMGWQFYGWVPLGRFLKGEEN